MAYLSHRILCSKYNTSCYYHFADDGEDIEGLPSDDDVEITYFELVLLSSLTRHLHVYESVSCFKGFV